MLKQNVMKLKQPLRTLWTPLDLDMFPMVERGDFKTVDVEMQAMNNGDILIACNITRYMGQWWKCFW